MTTALLAHQWHSSFEISSLSLSLFFFLHAYRIKPKIIPSNTSYIVSYRILFRSMVHINGTFGLYSTALSFLFFLLCRYIMDPLTYVRLFITKENHQISSSKPVLRTWFTYIDEQRWQRLNLLISWLHALITGGLVLYSFLVYPGLRADFVEHVNFVTYFTCSFSLGNFQ